VDRHGGGRSLGARRAAAPPAVATAVVAVATASSSSAPTPVCPSSPSTSFLWPPPPLPPPPPPPQLDHSGLTARAAAFLTTIHEPQTTENANIFSDSAADMDTTLSRPPTSTAMATTRRRTLELYRRTAARG